ncbi:MAG: FAD-binding oxidoreductase [Dehalococcoidales bacterium]|nr:MAG: FAD-binding oxidoreductase [Dehalococcoidales bacterium]
MKDNYGKLTEELVRELTDICRKGNVITDRDAMQDYARDESPQAESRLPDAVVKPEDAVTVSRILSFASKFKVPVTPRGAGTGLSGGCIPNFSGIVLSLENMNRIIRIDEENFTAVVEPGVPMADLCAEIESRGLYYPLYPGEMTATIGGTVSTNAGGMNAVRYGVTRNNILGLEAVLPNGDIINIGGEYVKSSSGYDLTQLIAGSEGTLAVITKVILKLTTKPPKREVLFAPFTSLEDAIDAVPEILHLKMIPVGLEFMERRIFTIIEDYLEREIPYPEYDAFLMIIMDGDSEDEIHDYFDTTGEICKRHGAAEALVPGSERAKRRLLEAREKFYHAIKRYAPMELIDTVVPRSKIPDFVRQVKEISVRHGITVIIYGHAGDGNVHLHPLCENMNEDDWKRKLPSMLEDIFHAAISFGGAVSGEHGIGIEKKPFLPIQIDEPLLAVMKRVKQAFDPDNILNPGKIFDI